jgi:hypothetical protein
MDNIDLQLYHEENRSHLIDLNKGVKELSLLVKQQIDNYVVPPEDIKVSGSVEVNTEKAVEVTNLEVIAKSIEQLQQTLTVAIEKNHIEPVTNITVDNIELAKTDRVTINNLTELKKYFDDLAIKIKDNQPIVNVTKQDIVFPTNANQAIPVRLSDGKSFYKAIFSAVTSGNSEADPTAGYQIADEENIDGTKYYGYTNKYGHWYIMRVASGAYRFTKGAPQAGGGGLYIDAWNNKVNLSYNYFHEVF